MGSSTEFYRVLAECIEAVDGRQSTVKDCLARYPKHAAELQQLLPLVTALQHVPKVEPPAEFRNGARQRLLARLPATFGTGARHPSRRYKEHLVGSVALRRRLSMAWLAALAVIVLLTAGGGIAYAADGAAPGDALYSLDRSIEQVRLQLTGSPQARFRLQLAQATERLTEAEDLLRKAKQDRFTDALDNYGSSVAQIAQTFRSSAAADQTVLGGLLDEAIASHDTLLANMTDYDGRTGDMIQTRDRWCSGESTEYHPVAEKLAGQWDVLLEDMSYEDILAEITYRFCVQGFGFGEINLAYRIYSEAETETTLDALFGARAHSGWGLIMQDSGLIGQPGEAGPSEGAPQGSSGGQGRSDDAKEGRSDNAQGSDNAGPADKNGPPVDVPQGPPAREGGSEDPGPPEGVPRGRPEEKGLPPGQETKTP